jgi:NADH:ubiquinone oxidoreductase subunit 4 (subunit M)
LAGLILKLGLYAIIKFLFFLFNNIQKDVIYNIILISYFGFLYTTLVAYNQIDLKKIIAYSSVAHMNFSVLSLFSESIVGLIGLVYLMIGHAFTSSALFTSIGVIYDRYKTRLICYFQSLIFLMPILGIMFFIFIISNFAFPATFNFVGELLILIGIINFNSFLLILILLPMVVTMIYSLFLYSRIFFGPFNIIFIRYFSDIIRLEAIILIVYSFFIIFGGLFPMFIIYYL